MSTATCFLRELSKREKSSSSGQKADAYNVDMLFWEFLLDFPVIDGVPESATGE